METSNFPVIRRLKRLIEANEAARKARHDTEVSRRIYLAERGGRVFIVCNGTAVAELPKARTVSEVTAEISRARRAALDYDGGAADTLPANTARHGD